MDYTPHLDIIHYLLKLHDVKLPLDEESATRFNYILDIVQIGFEPKESFKSTHVDECHLCGSPVKRIARNRFFTCRSCKIDNKRVYNSRYKTKNSP